MAAPTASAASSAARSASSEPSSACSSRGPCGLRAAPLALILIIAVMQLGAELFIGRNYTVALLFITPLALCMVQLGHPLPVAQLMADRAIETVLGVASRWPSR
ncbi:FUSC family protein [Microbacterium barkeri]|uniref:FUSC family protein n=1 Tax=Microbacterium barkeri TaxID=33917 RepID=UPI003613AD2F